MEAALFAGNSTKNKYPTWFFFKTLRGYVQTGATAPNNVGSCKPTMLRPFARGEKFDPFQTLRNNTQQHPTTCNRVCKRTQHVTSNKVGNCGSTMLHPFALSPILTLTSTMAWTQSSVLSKLRSAGRCWAIGDEAQESKNSLVKLPLLGFSSAVLGSVTKCSKKNLRHIHKVANSARWPEIRLYSFSLGIWIEIPAGKAKRIESPIKARMRMREYMKTAELGPGLRLSARLKCINYHYEPKRKEHACSRSFPLVL